MELWDCIAKEKVKAFGERPAALVEIDHDKVVAIETVRKDSVVRPDMTRINITTAEVVISNRVKREAVREKKNTN